MIYPVVYSTDANYLPYVGVSIQSIISNNSSNEKFKIFILHSNIQQSLQAKLLSMQSSNMEICFIDVEKHLSFNKNLLKTNGHYTKEMYYRFLIPYLFQDYEKVLYVDCDLVFNVNPKIYFNVNIEKNCLGAINDIGALNLKQQFCSYVHSLGIEPEKYFNSGVLIMNIKELVHLELYQKFINIIQKNRTFHYPDQDILNIICKDKVYYLDYAYNYQWVVYVDNLPCEFFSNKSLYQRYLDASKTPYIIHYITSRKPWNCPELPLSEYFWKYARLTHFYEEILLECFIFNASELFNVSIFDYYKYKIKSKIPSKKQARYETKCKEIKAKLKKIKRIK